MYFFIIKKANIFLIILYLMLIIMQNAFYSSRCRDY